jgi:hypothetical protein
MLGVSLLWKAQCYSKGGFDLLLFVPL